MSRKAHSVVSVSLNPTESETQENMHPIGAFPYFAIDHEPVPSGSMQLSNHEHLECSELYETPIVSPTLEAPDLSHQSMIQIVDFGGPSPLVVSFQSDSALMETATSGYSNVDHGGEHLRNCSNKTMYDSSEGDDSTFDPSDFTIQENSSTLCFSSLYSLSRYFTIDPHNEPLRHEAGIAVFEGRIQEGQDMFIKRMLELSCGIDTLSNEQS
ncbi:hypothetical protein L211DRAFT_848066 [Terfezia boudieri ATCC MYA-4762]|uniref:Uncharacterized protein n=1 Tax=Terfezia boudieri ATCC MYA-4762 TaxID=1051890 RepID=A0A3N4LU34_9PEZI|nr:hypothetical protein L211DRAFT_848066 [Terfezia boudieri ATCC MYA-4762]